MLVGESFVFVRLFLERVWPATVSAVRLLEDRSSFVRLFLGVLGSALGG